MNTKSKPLNVNFMVKEADRRRLYEVSERLSLSLSEVARRALRLGLEKFERVDFPGAENHAE